jgi:PKD repeat protein
MKMKTTAKTITTFFAVLASAGMLNAQLSCGASEANERLKQTNPQEIQQAADQLSQERDFMFAHPESRTSATYVIPVVFHILHDYGNENISDLQVLDAMAILNRDYALLNPDASLIIPEFQGIAAATDIEFRLATIDPDGNCTNGIEHIATKKTHLADDASKINRWPREKYLNIWVVKTLREPGISGYAYYPSSVTGMGAAIDGIVVLHDYVGSIGTSSPISSRTITHEAAHWMNLSHVWGNNNDQGMTCGDDGIPDTPITKGFSWCPTPNTAKICDTAIVENYQNFMDYSFCTHMFTYDQGTAMRSALNSSISSRNSLWTTSNLVATGTYTGTPATCAPVADFNANRYFICEGGTVTFTDFSWNATVTSWSWSFPGGTPSTSTVANPQVTYAANGIYPASLTVSNATGSASITKSGYIYVGVPYAEVTMPIVEGFDTPQSFNQGWIAYNNNNDGIAWHQTNATAATGTGAAVLDNFNNSANEVDALISPLCDLRYLTGMTLTFKTSFATQVQDTGLITESLRVMISTNCGQSWSTLAIKPGVTLLSGGLQPGYFLPPANDLNFWTVSTINVSTIYAQAHVRFKFEWTGGAFGNQLYLDDININATGVGINEASSVSSFDIFPNPSQDNSAIHFALTQRETVKITMTDLDGRVVKEISNGEFSEGEHSIAFSTAELASGMYLVTVDNGTTKQVKKLAVNH